MEIKGNLLFVGKRFSALAKAFDERGLEWLYLKDSRGRTLNPTPRTYHADFSSVDAVLKAASKIKEPIAGLVCIYENYVEATARLAEHLGLPGMTLEAARACSDKFVMRSRFAAAPERISPDFALVPSWDDAKRFAEQHDFPLILKPAGLQKSLLVSKSRDLEELRDNFGRSMEQLGDAYARYSPYKQPRLLIEEFLEGSVHSVEGYADNNGNITILEHVVDYETGYDVGLDDNFHYSRLLPSRLSRDEQSAIRHCASLGMKALGMKSTPAHVEVILTAAGPRLVEIGARNGGYRFRMHELANGLDLVQALVDTATGNPVFLESTKQDNVAVLEIFPLEQGIFDRITSLGRLHKLESFHYVSVKRKHGDAVGKSSDGHKACAVVFLRHTDRDTFEHDLHFVRENVGVELISR